MNTYKEIFTNLTLPSIKQSNEHLTKTTLRNQIKDNFPIIGNIISLGMNLTNIEWKTLSISLNQQEKLFNILKTEMIDINDVFMHFSENTIKKIGTYKKKLYEKQAEKNRKFNF